MRDALLFKHMLPETPARVIDAFECVMTDVLSARVTGKASIGEREQLILPPPGSSPLEGR